jgi:hypothetical protein
MTEALYRKVMRGKRTTYELAYSCSRWAYEHDLLKPGQFRLEYASGDGMRRYAYPVSPDVAGWEAAALIARVAMEKTIRDAAQCVPQTRGAIPYTKKQQAILARFQREMADAGAQLPQWWQFAGAHEISSAAIEAVRNYKP